MANNSIGSFGMVILGCVLLMSLGCRVQTNHPVVSCSGDTIKETAANAGLPENREPQSSTQLVDRNRVYNDDMALEIGKPLFSLDESFTIEQFEAAYSKIYPNHAYDSIEVHDTLTSGSAKAYILKVSGDLISYIFGIQTSEPSGRVYFHNLKIGFDESFYQGYNVFGDLIYKLMYIGYMDLGPTYDEYIVILREGFIHSDDSWSSEGSMGCERFCNNADEAPCPCDKDPEDEYVECDTEKYIDCRHEEFEREHYGYITQEVYQDFLVYIKETSGEIVRMRNKFVGQLDSEVVFDRKIDLGKALREVVPGH